ncbi:hypothetical protein BT67DRAFT_177832 [Trichocladium antarcticum]|uniref:Uncharacterized protein n=1 Tax=Trichocladium antarcticum TaxID=1450529 RepID=A0AAN6ZER6_9PEZI|nr:hypothetical protein BT67DRAFT_177832 [Trichocladium antarcticum]
MYMYTWSFSANGVLAPGPASRSGGTTRETPEAYKVQTTVRMHGNRRKVSLLLTAHEYAMAKRSTAIGKGPSDLSKLCATAVVPIQEQICFCKTIPLASSLMLPNSAQIQSTRQRTWLGCGHRGSLDDAPIRPALLPTRAGLMHRATLRHRPG